MRRDIDVMFVACLLFNGGLVQNLLLKGLSSRHQLAAFCVRKEE